MKRGMYDTSMDLSEFALNMGCTRLVNVWSEVCVGIINGARITGLTETMLAVAND